VTEIEEKIEILQDLSAKTSGLLQRIQTVRAKAKQEIDGEGLTQETCTAMAHLMSQLHKETARLHNGGHLVHADMQNLLPEGMNEGNKDWPPQP
jgi:Ser/Thr protein kinase RdoA (MazF antagonist)